jgi:hypothetical protein
VWEAIELLQSRRDRQTEGRLHTDQIGVQSRHEIPCVRNEWIPAIAKRQVVCVTLRFPAIIISLWSRRCSSILYCFDASYHYVTNAVGREFDRVGKCFPSHIISHVVRNVSKMTRKERDRYEEPGCLHIDSSTWSCHMYSIA